MCYSLTAGALTHTHAHTPYHDSGESRYRSETSEACGVTRIQHVREHPANTTCQKAGVQGVASGEHQGGAIEDTCMLRRGETKFEGWILFMKGGKERGLGIKYHLQKLQTNLCIYHSSVTFIVSKAQIETSRFQDFTT